MNPNPPSSIAASRRLPPVPGRLLTKERRLPPCAGGSIAKERRLEKAASGISLFGLSIRAAARILWRGEGSIGEYVDTIDAAVRIGYERAWQEGAAACGILPADRTPEERTTLDGFIVTAQTHYMNLADFIMNNSRANGGKWGSLLPRLNIWVQRYNEVRETAQSMSCKDSKAVWVYGDTVDHCADCSRVVGRIYRMSIWDKYGWIPGSRALACGGWNCDCKRVPTIEPVTPGRPPALKGA